MRSSKKALVVVSAVSVVLLLGLAWFMSRFWIRGDVPGFATPAWGESGKLMVRAQGDGSDVILLKHVTYERNDTTSSAPAEPLGVVYRYDGRRAVLEQVDEKAWDNATGEPCDCLSQLAPRKGLLTIDRETDSLKCGDRVIPTAGATTLGFTLAPRGGLVAVLSTSGSRDVSIMPFLGAGGASGQHYHQVFKVPEMTPVGSAVRLPLASEFGILRICWSPGRQYVVYATASFDRLRIVPVNMAGGP